TASAQSSPPPASCVKRFVGTWIVTVKATGQTYPATVLANGTGHATCPACMPMQHWTCSGNTFILLDPRTEEAPLSADGTGTESACCVSVRAGGASRLGHAAQGASQVGISATRTQPQGIRDRIQ